MKRFIFIIISLSVFVLAFCWFIWSSLPSFAETWIEKNSNGALQNVDIKNIRVRKDFRAEISGVRASFIGKQGAIPLSLNSVYSLEPVIVVLKGKRIRFNFEGFKPVASSSQGLSGEFSLGLLPRFHFELSANMAGLKLQDFEWLDPEDLSGASGSLKGNLRYLQEEDEPPIVDMTLEFPEGGFVQAKFFDLFLPYLPQSSQKQKVAELTTEGKKLVRFKTAAVALTMPSGDRMKIMMKILVLDYNLKLTINADIRTDSENSFIKIAQWMGLIEVKR